MECPTMDDEIRNKNNWHSFLFFACKRTEGQTQCGGVFPSDGTCLSIQSFTCVPFMSLVIMEFYLRALYVFGDHGVVDIQDKSDLGWAP